MEGVGLIHSDKLQRCLKQNSKSYNNSQLHPELNGKLVKMFEEKESRLGGENGGKERMGEMERIPVENRKQE